MIYVDLSQCQYVQNCFYKKFSKFFLKLYFKFCLFHNLTIWSLQECINNVVISISGVMNLKKIACYLYLLDVLKVITGVNINPLL